LKGLAELEDFKLGRQDVSNHRGYRFADIVHAVIGEDRLRYRDGKISGHRVSFSRSQKISPSVNWPFLRCGGH
jgi:hypothetical protein